MRITESSIGFASQHAQVERVEVKESLRVTFTPPAPPPSADRVDVSAAGAERASRTQLEDEEETLDPELEMLKLIVEHVFGRKVKLLKMPKPADVEAEAAKAAERTRRSQASAGGGIGIAYDREEKHVEAEETAVRAEGVIRTSDGKDIAFTLEMNLARLRVETQEVHIRLGTAEATDPLVVNFGRPAAELTTDRVVFDIDSDGAGERIAGLAAGSGWLAIDRNGDGKITSGQELFGPATGDGYAELAREDADRNGWIDEADPIFARLVLVTGQGEDGVVTVTLDEAGVGAVGIARAEAPFTYKDQSGTTLGVSRGAGIFVTEGGGIGTTQQVDVVV